MSVAVSPSLAALRTAQRGLEPISLADVLMVAELQTRVDRKYLVGPAVLQTLVDRVGPTHRVLEIEGRRDFRYDSVYFDTPEMTSYTQAARGRRSRFKVRTRTYLDSDQCLLEVKTAGGRDQTVKDRMPYRTVDRERLDGRAREFVDDRVDLPDGAGSLAPVLSTRYSRTTLVDAASGSRLTCDADLRVVDATGREQLLGGLVLVETKSAGPALAADRELWRLGERPVRISKFCVGMATLDPSLPANRWHRTLQRYFV